MSPNRYFLSLASIILLWSALETPVSSLTQDSYPKQEECPSIPAKKLIQAGSSAGKWALVKVTPLPNPPPPQFDLKLNFCHPFSYIPATCQGLVVEFTEYKDKSIAFMTLGYNNRTKSLIHFGLIAQLKDQRYAIYQEELDLYPHLMEEYFDDGRYKYYYPPPRFILDSQGEEFLKVARGSDNKWMIFQNCVTKYAWVLMKDDVKISELAQYQREYVAALNVLNIDVKSMVDVPIEDDQWDKVS